MRKLKNLFTPIRIGTVEVKNRIAMAPMGTNLSSPGGEITQKQIYHYEARAKGGVGLIIVEDATIGPNYTAYTTSLADDRFIHGWRNLTKILHAYGAKVMPGIFHPSFNAPSALNAGAQPVAASPIPSRMLREIPRELTVNEIQEIIQQFGEAARRAKEGGCDGVQVHCSHMHHLLGGFLTPYYNKRADQYGGPIENRVRLPLEVLRHIRSKVGQDFGIIIRVSGAEYLPGGLTLDEVVYIAPLLAEAGADAIHISAGTTTNTWVVTPPTGWSQAPNVPLASAVKKVVNVPVICVGRITLPWMAENVIATGKTDMVAMARALLADAQWPNKAAKGEWEDIAPCVGDSQCLIKIAFGHPIACSVNPAAGRDKEMELIPTKSPKKVVVVGGGPAGMEVARVAALRGHKVTLTEKSSKLGGQMLLASVPPMKQEYTYAVQYLANQVHKSGAKVELNQEVTLENLNKFAPDVVVIATGGTPIIPTNILGVNKNNVATAWDVLSGKIFPGPKVAIIGGGKVGCETADYVAHIVDDLMPGGNQVTILEMLDNIILDDFTPWRSVLIQRLKNKGVKIITQAKVTEILDDGVKYLIDGHEETLRSINHIVLAVGTKSNDPLSEKLRGSSIETYIIGDAREPQKVLEAVSDAAEIGRKI